MKNLDKIQKKTKKGKRSRKQRPAQVWHYWALLVLACDFDPSNNRVQTGSWVGPNITADRHSASRIDGPTGLEAWSPVIKQIKGSETPHVCVQRQQYCSAVQDGRDLPGPGKSRQDKQREILFLAPFYGWRTSQSPEPTGLKLEVPTRVNQGRNQLRSTRNKLKFGMLNT